MDNKIVGIPLVVWIFIILLGVVILSPIWFFMHVPEMAALRRIEQMEAVKTRVVLVTPAVTATPSATATPTLPIYRFNAPVNPTQAIK